MTKHKTRISLAVCALALCLTATTAQAASAHTKTVPVDATFVGQTKLDRVDCTTHLGVCELYFSGVANYTGGRVRGVNTFALHGHVVPAKGFVYINHTKFAGSIRGCGTGTARNVGYGTIDQIAPFGALSPTIDPLKAGNSTGEIKKGSTVIVERLATAIVDKPGQARDSWDVPQRGLQTVSVPPPPKRPR